MILHETHAGQKSAAAQCGIHFHIFPYIFKRNIKGPWLTKMANYTDPIRGEILWRKGERTGSHWFPPVCTVKHHRGSSDKECLMILKWWWPAWWQTSVDSRYLWSQANKDCLIVLFVISVSSRMAEFQSRLKFPLFWFILRVWAAKSSAPSRLGQWRKWPGLRPLNHFGKHPSWEVLRNAKNGTNPCPMLF